MLNKTELANIFLALSIAVFFISIHHFQQTIKNAEEYQKDLKEELKEKIDRDYFLAYSGTKNVENNTMGQYFYDSENIIVYTKKRPLWDIEETWQHEKGHLIFLRDLNESQRAEWELLFNNSVDGSLLNENGKFELLANGSSYFVSEYAKTDYEQDFAESFSAWVLKWNKLDFKKELFMKKYVEELV